MKGYLSASNLAFKILRWAKAKGCGKTKEIAGTYVLVGVLYLVSSKDLKLARVAWRRALLHWPSVRVPGEIESQLVRTYFNEVKRKLIRSGKIKSPDRHLRPGRLPMLPGARRPAPRMPAIGHRRRTAVRRRRHVDRYGRARRVTLFAVDGSMKWDPSLYGVGSRLAWRRFRRATALRDWGIGLTLGSVGVCVLFPLIGHYISDDHPKGGAVLLWGGVAVAALMLGTGTGLWIAGTNKRKEAGLLVLKTKSDRFSSISVDVGAGTLAVKGRFQ
jgi:hypothetical protein